MKDKYKRKSIRRVDRTEVNERDGVKCYECESLLKLDPKGNGKVIGGQHHHIIPMVYGGSNSASNMVLLCEKCHIKIHSRDEGFGEKYFDMYQKFINRKKLMSL